MGLQKRITEVRRHDLRDGPSGVRLVACVLCHQAGGQRGTSPLKKMRDPMSGQMIYFHFKGCPRES